MSCIICYREKCTCEPGRLTKVWLVSTMFWLTACAHTYPKPVPAEPIKASCVAASGVVLGAAALPPRGDNLLFPCAECDDTQKTKVALAQAMANKIVASDCFHDFMVKRPLIQTNGETPEQVVTDLRTAKQAAPVHYYLKRFGVGGRVIGYRQPPKPDIYFNNKFHKYYGVCDTASNASHEWSHVIGYDHAFNATKDRGYSVPYSINAAFEACCVGSNGFRGSN